MKGTLVKVSVLVLASVALNVPLAHRLFACTPSLGDPWFDIKLSADESTLPSGIELVQNSFTNSSSEPFYLFRDVSYRFDLPEGSRLPINPNSGLPLNYEPLDKVTSDHSYFWGELGNDVKSWHLNEQNNDFFALLNFSKPKINILWNQIALKLHLRQMDGNDRPADVKIPNPHTFKILGYYRNETVEITGTISYSLNNQYDTRGGGGCDFLSDSSDQSNSSLESKMIPFTYLLIFLGLLSGVGLLIYTIVRRPRK